MTRLIHLNGPPGIGKSTLARMYADDHPGVLCCDIDVLRTLVGGWETRFAETGGLIRPAALAMITAYLTGGHDVVLPQLIARPAELARFAAAAAAADAELVEVVVWDDEESSVARFNRRGAAGDSDTHDRVRALAADDDTLRGYHAVLDELRQRPGVLVVDSLDGDVDATYTGLLEALDA